MAKGLKKNAGYTEKCSGKPQDVCLEQFLRMLLVILRISRTVIA
jgi:hypothetical protein